jgi:hypothetical protein
MEAKAIKEDATVQAAEAGLKEAKAAVLAAEEQRQQLADRRRREDVERERNDPIRKAVREHQVIKGMNEQQVREALGFKSDAREAIWQAQQTITDLGDGRQISVWHVGYTSPLNVGFVETRLIRVELRDGVVVQISQTRNELLDNEPK